MSKRLASGLAMMMIVACIRRSDRSDASPARPESNTINVAESNDSAWSKSDRTNNHTELRQLREAREIHERQERELAHMVRQASLCGRDNRIGLSGQHCTSYQQQLGNGRAFPDQLSWRQLQQFYDQYAFRRRQQPFGGRWTIPPARNVRTGWPAAVRSPSWSTVPCPSTTSQVGG